MKHNSNKQVKSTSEVLSRLVNLKNDTVATAAVLYVNLLLSVSARRAVCRYYANSMASGLPERNASRRKKLRLGTRAASMASGSLRGTCLELTF